jgi:REP element-mobilizing transposase RayT
VLHRERAPVPGDCPVHVTLRVKANLPSLRDGRFVREWRRSLAEASERGDFRVNHYSLQGDHAHLIVEAHGKDALARGMKSIAARLARALNRIAARSGPVLDSRYHHRSLRTPGKVRLARAYVLLNARRHLAKRRHVSRAASVPLDPASSARWFDGWRRDASARDSETSAVPEIASPHTWLLRVGWRRHGLVDPAESPGSDPTFPRELNPLGIVRDSGGARAHRVPLA